MLQTIPPVATARYELVSELGAGSMGRVFRARDKSSRDEVALKTLLNYQAEDLYRLKGEFRALTDLAHPNLVELYELFVEGDLGCFTMELIEGRDFVSHLAALKNDRGEIAENEVFSLVDQLAAGLDALHAREKLHRDIKPANVMVSRAGRVVLLDFGLAVDRRGDRGDRDVSGFSGTIAYQAPEILADQLMSPAADWYSVGVMLFEALAGAPPFAGTAYEILQAKMSEPAPSLKIRVPGISVELETIVRGLLESDPAERLKASELKRIVRTRLGRAEAAPPLPESESFFVGRASELRTLRERFTASSTESSKSSKPIAVQIAGPPGIGKSTLVRRFLRTLGKETSIFSSRCLPQESVPYKALDGIIDDLARWFVRRPEVKIELSAEQATALTTLFSILKRIPELAEAKGVLQPLELRQIAVRALEHLLQRVTSQGPAVVWIDDLQWIDQDSAFLLKSLFRRLAEPILFVFSHRIESAEAEQLIRELRTLPAFEVERLALEGLEMGELTELARSLLSSDEAYGALDEGEVDVIARGSSGSPLVLQHFAHYLSTHGRGRALPEGGLSNVLADRVRALPEQAQRLVEVVAVAGRAVPRAIAVAAASIAEREHPSVAVLRTHRLIQPAAVAGSIGLDITHDSVREAIAKSIPSDRKRELHLKLIDAYKKGSAVPDPALLLEHYLGAELRGEAATCAFDVARLAEETFAFNTAAAHYALALSLGATVLPRWQILAKCAQAHARAGRAEDAGKFFREASVTADPSERRMLNRESAEQFLRGGYLSEGLTAMKEVLRAEGVAYPASNATVFANILVRRLQLRLRGWRYREKKEAEVGAAELARIDACWAATLGLNMIDILRSAGFQAKHSVLALDAGEPKRVARALTAEMVYLANEGRLKNRERSAELMKRAEDICTRLDDPWPMMFLHLCAGAAFFFQGRWNEGLARLETTEAALMRARYGMIWERTNCRMYSAWCHTYRGDALALAKLMQDVAGEMEDGGDFLARAGLWSGLASTHWLIAGEPEVAREKSRAATEPFPKATFQSPHYFDFIAQTQADLYDGNGEAAWQRVESTWPKLERALFLRMQFFRIEARFLRARAALASGRIEVARKDAERLAKEDLAFASPLASLVHAGVAFARGDEVGGRAQASIAARRAAECEMAIHEAVAKEAAGVPQDAWWRKQGVKETKKLSQLYLPRPTPR